jgi:hypothetical protein
MVMLTGIPKLQMTSVQLSLNAALGGGKGNSDNTNSSSDNGNSTPSNANAKKAQAATK